MSLTDSSLERRLQRYTRQDGDCLRWIGVRNSGGYGRLSVNGKAKSAHRVAYELWVGAIPDGLEIDHLCRVRDCVRPEHLRAVTHSEHSLFVLMACCGSTVTANRLGGSTAWDRLRPQSRGSIGR